MNSTARFFAAASRTSRSRRASSFCMRCRLGLLLLAAVLLGAGHADAYGFDCGQGSAMLFLSSHSQCGSKAHMACFASLAMRVKQCQIKAWPHHPNSHRRPCWGLQLLASVTDVNTANGSLTIPMHGSGRHISVPAQLNFSRPEEVMLLRAGPCLMRFQAAPAADETLAPVPGEGRGAWSSLLRLLVPAVVVPAVVVGLLLVAAGRTPHAARNAVFDDGSSPGSPEDPAAYEPLADTPDPSDSGSSLDGPLAERPCTSLLLKTFNLKAMSRRARARRLRRSTRPVYVGPPDTAPGAAQLYAGSQPGPSGGLVAPYFRFPPVAVPPALEAIPESVTPSSGSAPPSRTSSSSDLETTSLLLPAPAPPAPPAAQQQQRQSSADGDACSTAAGPVGSAASCPGLSAIHPWSRRVQQHSLKQQQLSQQFLSSLAGSPVPDGCGDRLLLGAWFQQQQQPQPQQQPQQQSPWLQQTRLETD